MTAHHTDIVRKNRERWFREVPGAREAYLTDAQIRLTTDSVDAALSMADREMTAQGIAADVREHVLTAAVFGTVYDYEKPCPRCTPDAHCGHDFDDSGDPVAMPLRRPDGRYILTDDLDNLS